MWKQWPWSWDESQNKPAPAHHHSLLVLLLYVRPRKCQIASFLKLLLKLFESAAAKKKKKETLQQVLVEKSWMYNSMNFHKLITPVPAKGPSILASDSMLIVPGFVFHMNVIRQHTLQHGFVFCFFFLLIFMFVGFIGIVACSFKSFIFIVL